MTRAIYFSSDKLLNKNNVDFCKLHIHPADYDAAELQFDQLLHLFTGSI